MADIRPIDANALKLAMSQSYNDPENVIDEAPTLDYAPVRHGEWVGYYEEDPWPLEWRYHCSLCGCQQFFARNYCPNCGAKMDGGKKDVQQKETPDRT